MIIWYLVIIINIVVFVDAKYQISILKIIKHLIRFVNYDFDLIIYQLIILSVFIENKKQVE